MLHEETLVLGEREFATIGRLAHEHFGLDLHAGKQGMVAARLSKRIRQLGLRSFEEYCHYVLQDRTGAALESMVEDLTTNHTSFFREPRHFDFLVDRVLPQLTNGNGETRPFLIWSAGCSTGEEPYTLAMILSEYRMAHPGFRFRILATDISTAVLAKAEVGIYTNEAVAPVQAALRMKYFLRSRDRASNRVRVSPELRRLVEFHRLNFMDADYGISERADAIFCRNVIIYFDRPTQRRILRKLCDHLVPGGYLFVGHAETLHDMNLPVTPVAPALYRRVDAAR